MLFYQKEKSCNICKTHGSKIPQFELSFLLKILVGNHLIYFLGDLDIPAILERCKVPGCKTSQGKHFQSVRQRHRDNLKKRQRNRLRTVSSVWASTLFFYGHLHMKECSGISRGCCQCTPSMDPNSFVLTYTFFSVASVIFAGLGR